MSYEIEYLKRQIREAAERVIEAAAVGIYPDTEEHRATQLKAITDTLTPHDWLELLKK
ncbi:TPA: hypothetical protein ACITN2_004666 [Salmonella enterica subsp. enterica serovar Virchow]